jgi:glycosyltransferase involved in cell wall biosynthesis
MISIIIRTKNEERWISLCLKAVFEQSYTVFEVILVDNNSTDRTVAKAKEFDVKVVNIDKFKPGAAINLGVRTSVGEYIVCLSGHCIPVNDQWLYRLVSSFDNDERIAGVYGRQEPMSFTPDIDKRDLLITFGLDQRVQVKDSFFHNANSMIRREVWAKYPFNEEVSNIEDRVWADQVLKAGYKIIYQPEASVYHYHGIHRMGNQTLCTSVVKILEPIVNPAFQSKDTIIDIKKLNIVAVIPVRDENLELAGKPLFEYSINHAKQSKYIKKIVVSTGDGQIASQAELLGAEVPFLRDEEHSHFDVILEKLMQYVLQELEKRGVFPDIFVMLEITFPFRDSSLIDQLIYELVVKGLDTVIPAKKDYNSCWMEKDGSYKRIDEGYIPRQLKKPVYTGIKGLGCVTHANVVRQGQLFGENVGIYEVTNPILFMEVRHESQRNLGELILSNLKSLHDITLLRNAH